MSDIFEFANGIRHFTADLLPEQVARYARLAVPLHEPVEEHWFETLTAAAGPGRFVFLDIGSALGYYAILVKKRRPDARVVAVDPNPQFHARFAATLALNGLGPGDVELVPKAVAGTPGTVRFALKSYGAHVAHGPTAPTVETIDVEAITLDALLADLDETVTLAKLDIQGLEQGVLERSKAVAAGTAVRNWIVGTHGPRIHARVVELLSPRHRILLDDPNPPDQPDGLVVATALHA
jgi:FkbM family methyltransferase